MRVSYEIDGAINGEGIAGRGMASVDPSRGRTVLEVRFDARPRGWDPRSIILCCCSCTLALPAREVSGARNLLALSGGEVTIGRELSGACRQASILDARGAQLAQVSASSATCLRGDGAFDRSTVHGGFSEMEPGVRGIARIGSVRGIMFPVGDRLINVTTSYDLELEDGVMAYGTTTYPYFLPTPVCGLNSAQSFQLGVLACEFMGNALYAEVESVVSTISVDIGNMSAMTPLLAAE